jgi:hypothetical protein
MSRKEFSLEEVLTVAMDRNFVGKIGEAFALAAHLLGEKRIDGPTYGQEIAKLQQGLVKQIPQLRNYVDKLGEAQAVTTKEKAEDAARDIEMFLAKAAKDLGASMFEILPIDEYEAELKPTTKAAK